MTIFAPKTFKLRKIHIMEHSLKDITAVVNHKGGVAKTSTALSLAGGLLRSNKKARVLLIDMDPQCNLSMLCGWDIKNPQKHPTIYNALSKEGEGMGVPVYKSENGYYYSPSSKELQGVDRDLHNQTIPQGVLFNRFGYPVDDHTGDGLTDIVTSFDYVLIDCPPSLSDTTSNAIVVASRILIPVQLEPLSYNGLSSILVKQTKLDIELRKLLMGAAYEKQDISIVPVMTDGDTRVARLYLESLHDSFGEFLTKSRVRKDVKMRESQGLFTDIFNYAPYSRVAIDYEQLIKELYN